MKTKTTKITGILLTLVMLVTMLGMFSLAVSASTSDTWDGTAASQAWESGSGIEDDPYVIMTAEQLAKLATDVNNGTYYETIYFKLGANLDLAGYNWTPIGGYHSDNQSSSAASNAFAGIFDGDNKTISNMKSEGPTSNYAYAGYRGLFGNLSGTLKNLTMTAPQISGRQSYFGAAVAHADGATISGVTVNNPNFAHTNSAKYNGGVVGYIANGTVENCKVVGGNIVASSVSDSLGGIVGYATDVVISDCTVENAIISSKSQYVGGIVGQIKYTDGTNSITNCTVKNSNIISTSSGVGGIVGYTYGNSSGVITVKLCSVTGGSVSASYYVGGIMGQSFYADIIGCANYGASVTATTSTGYAGGILGYYNYGKCYSCFSSATITASKYPGAIIGRNNNSVYQCAYDKSLYTDSISSSYGTGFTTDEIKVGAAAWFLSNTGTNVKNYKNWAQKINTDEYPVWNTENEAKSVVYKIENNDGTTTYYNAGDPNGFAPAADGYYEIDSANDWYRFARIVENDPTAKAKLVKDVDFTCVTDLSGYVIKSFSGILDGQGFTVKNINTTVTKNFALFTTINAGGVVKNIKFDTISITSATNYVYVNLLSDTNRGTIENVSASNVTLGANYAAVIADENYGTITGCTLSSIDLDSKYSSGAVTRTNYTGASIENCSVVSGSVTIYNNGTSSDVYGGGIVGTVSGGSILNCSNGATVSVTGGRTVSAGGIAGYITSPSATPASFIRCRNTGAVSTTDLNTGNGSDYAGGITGYNSSGYYNIEECYNTGNITARANAAGICGYRPYGSANVINNCWNGGTITTTITSTSSGAAGIAGSGNAIVKNCLNIGTVVTAGYGNPIVATSSGSQPGKTQLVNSFALDGCVESSAEGGTVSGAQYYGYDASGNRIASGVSATDLANGTVLAALNAGNTDPVWGQVEGNAHPILLANNDLVRTTVTLSGVTATDKTYDKIANVGYTGMITATHDYDISQITVTYSGTVADGTAYNAAEPPTNAGEYTVTFAIPVSDLVYSGELTLSFKIIKASVSDISTPTEQTANINTTLDDITLPEGWAWTDGTTVLSALGTSEYTAYFALTDEQIANYNYESLEGFNAAAKCIERAVEVTVTLIQIAFDSCDDAEIPYGSAVTFNGVPMIGETVLTKDNDYTVKVYTVGSDGNIVELLTSTPSSVGKYLVIIDVDNTIYDSANYEIVGGEPETIIGENATTMATTYDCAYIIEITPLILDIVYSPTTVGYTSQPIEARPTVKNGDTILTLDTDYTITYYSVDENGIITDMRSSAPIDMGKYLYVITLIGSYADPVYGIEGGVPTIVTGVTTLDDLANYRCAAILTIGEAGSGSVDLSEIEKKIAELEADIEELNKLIEEGGDIDTINDKITEITNRVKALEDNGATDDELAQVKQDITDAYTEAVDKVAEDLESAKTALENAINTNEADIEDKVTKLDEAYKAADSLINSEIAANKQSITDLADAMNDADEALQAAIDKVAEDLESAKTELQNAINTNEADIEDKVSKLDEAYKAADALINSDIAGLKNEDTAIKQSMTDLETALKAADDALAVAIKQVQRKLDEAKAELKAAIDANEADIEDKVSKLDEAYKAADILINSDIAGLKNEDTAIKQSITALTDAMNDADKALQTALDKVIEDLEKAKTELQNAINTNEADIEDKVSKLDEALETAVDTFTAAGEALNQKFEDADAVLKAAIDKVAKNLDEAKTALQTAINANEADIEKKVADLTKALENAKETLKAASAADKSALVSKIDEADAALQAAIDKVVKDLADTKAELVAKDESLTTMAVIAIVIASIGVCGCGGFVTWFFLDRKKKI